MKTNEDTILVSRCYFKIKTRLAVNLNSNIHDLVDKTAVSISFVEDKRSSVITQYR